MRRLQRDGWLRPGASCVWAWHRDGEQTGSVGLLAEAHALRVMCSVNNQPADHHIQLERTPCHYGGARTWFRCPSCHQRAAVLHLRGKAPFRCRSCARLAYASQSEDRMGRAWRKQKKAEAKLSPDGSKPPGMHWATYERLQAVIENCEARRDAELLRVAANWFGALR
ncbi:hypothetical protein [Inhella proteolytica]|uniref:Uncharacterized protein n=1 Tax=Inhella proteolytica TaxID=2795029 RepID=A0A931NIR6_9BURK|nr:hypothetical protein [Inhella proteolytica]MBH9577865.1 hypothetical protein [Inhella proteolytica]